ncbi:rod shape-determining protein RodA [Dehalobacterium formicoaceticum]|uniref:Peptidoglycan glycosyltransferase RodA n=1 Tax=Dehalobacterium formicoaceticum TaxID=51515 RepID=A0ABT1Y2A1_9FIRM|nr:rod shape-determining protein RodA [Dehalobacterium formicoaceticum]MCR6544999.1 rod shape-determining protein RodA [Dehalobacterium formicoaceticum]
MFNTRFLKNIDWIFMGSLLAIILVSLVILRSASANVFDDPYYFVKRQVLWAVVGLLLMFFVASFDYSYLARFGNYIYLVNIALLLAVFVLGYESKGAQRWIDLGFFDLQPSELAKVAIIISFAAFLVKRQGGLETIWDLIPCLVYVGIPLLLILKQPDLGTSLVFLAILLGMLWVGGANPRIIMIILLVILLFVLIIFGILFISTDGFQKVPEDLPIPLPFKPYQLLRLVIFINPDMDPLGAGYHVIQSKVAIGSGGFWGKGYQQGSQVQGDFLPEHHTDFVFSTIGEELGFLGGIGVLGLYLILLWRMIYIAKDARDLFGSLIVTGVASMLVFQILINTGMTMGIMPVTGIPLPFLTYGGSGMLSNMIAMGLVLSVNLHKQNLLF